MKFTGLILSILAASHPPSAPVAPASHPRIDVTASVGLLNLDRKAGSYPRGFESSTGFIQVTAGYYWNAHLRTDFGVGWTGLRKDTYEEELWDTAQRFDDVFLEHRYRIVRLSAAQLYEIGHARLRLFVGAGAGVDLDFNHDIREDFSEPALTAARRLSYTQAGIVLTTVDLFPCIALASPRGSSECALPDADHTTIRPFAFFTAGAKIRLSNHAFIDVRAYVGNRRTTNLMFGVGFGF